MSKSESILKDITKEK